MPIVRPFVGLVYDLSTAGSLDTITAPPYDTISPIDQERYHHANPYNVIRLILGRDEPGDGAAGNKYTRAGDYLRKWRQEGVLRPTAHPSLYPYELRFHHGGVERRVRGVIAEVELEPWGGGIIPHERTLPGPLEDRLRLLREVRANLSPVYAVHAGPAPHVAAFLEEAMSRPPASLVTDEDGTVHRLWISTDGEAGLAEALRRDTLLIADGHHRYTVSLAYREEMRERFGPGPWDSMMMLIVDGDLEDPPVLPIHRVVARGDVPQDGRLGDYRVRDLAEVLASLDDDGLTYGSVRMENGEPIHQVGSLQGAPPTVCALHGALLDRADVDLRFVPDAVKAEHAVVAGEATEAFFLPPTRVNRVRAVVERGGMLPQKSTYFWPKPRTGMVIRPFEV